MLSVLHKPARESIFKKHYLPGLKRHGVENVILCHISDVGYPLSEADTGELLFMPLPEACWKIERFFSEERPDSALTLTSILSTGRRLRYLFLVDFFLPVSRANESELVEILHDARWALPALQDGMVLRTQRSYHAVGFTPLSRDEWERHMHTMLLLRTRKGERFVDESYMDLSLRRGYGSLRITDYVAKGVPEFMCTL